MHSRTLARPFAHCLRLLATALVTALVTVPFASLAQDYPTRPVRIVVGFGPGGVADITSRLLAQQLGEQVGQPFLVDNRPGAGGIVAAEAIAKSAPDGHNLLLITNGNAAAVSLMKSLPYDPVNGFAMIVPLASFGLVIVTSRDSKINTVKDILTLARAAPDRFNIGTINIGSTQHLSMEVFRAQAGIPINSVTYKSTPAMIGALQGNEVQVGFEVLSPVLGQIKGGALRAVAVTTARRFEGLPDVPTVIESGLPKFDVSAWNGIAAPAKTPRAIIDRLNKEVNAAISRPDLRKRMLELAVVPLGGTPEDMTKLLVSEIKRWGAVVADAKIPKQ